MMNAEQLHAMKQQGLTLLSANRPAEARTLLSQVCEQNPDDVDAWYLLSCIHGMQGNMEEAGRCCRRAIALRPNHSEAHVNLGNVLLSQRKLDEAILHYQTAIRINPSNAGALCNIGNALSSLGKHDDAIINYQAALKLNQNFVEAYYNLGNSQMAKKRYSEAINSFRHVIRLNPKNAAAYNNLGIAYKECGDDSAAIENYRIAIRLQPDRAVTYNNLAIVLRQQGMLQEASDTAQRALSIQPDYADALLNLGSILIDQGEVEKGIECLQHTININPQHADAFNNLGLAFMKQGKLQEAKDMVESALKINPELAEAACNLGNISYSLGLTELAIEKFRQAILLKPDYVEAYIHLGNALIKQGMTSEAITCYQHAIALKPDSIKAHSNLAEALRIQGKLTEAEQIAKGALHLNPDSAYAYSALDLIYFLQGKIKASIEMGKKAVLLDPSYEVAQDNLLMGMHYDPDYSMETLFDAAQKWGARHATRDDCLPPPANTPDPERRLRIGYVSADFKTHPVGFFIEQVLAQHDKNQFEIFCYSNLATDDDLTARLRRHANHWTNILYRSDKEFAQLVRQDGIDLLIDLSGHTSGNRLLSFDYKPAPIQATWIGYHATTGLRAMDYIIGDRFLIPPEEECYYVERVLRLSNAYLCFSPPDSDIEPGPLPALATGKITFGCFNNPSKLTEELIASWSRLLNALPQAMLYLKYRAFADEGVRQRYQSLFAEQGVDVARIRFAGSSPRHEYLAAYQEVDIGLDPFPFNGCTTTLESLWMGVPVVTLRGDRYVSHMGESIMMNLGMEELVTHSEDAYIAKAIALASDLPRLATLRSGMRTKLLKSPLCDGPEFTRDLEAAYRNIWQTWCRAQANPA
jgi:protein O-GlcNAc transferase